MASASLLGSCALLGALTVAAIAMNTPTLADGTSQRADSVQDSLSAARDRREPETASKRQESNGHVSEHLELGREERVSSATARATGESASVAVTVSVGKGAKGKAPSRATSRSMSQSP